MKLKTVKKGQLIDSGWGKKDQITQKEKYIN